MVAVNEAQADVTDGTDPPSAVRERLEAFGVEVLAEAMNRPVQVRNGGLYLRGLIEQGARKSLEPLVQRLGDDADYQSMQQFLADSPWDPGLVIKAVAERVAAVIDVEAWVLDDTGFPKDGKAGVPQLEGARKAEIARKHWGFGHCAACAPCVYRPLGGRRASEGAAGAGAFSSEALGIAEKPVPTGFFDIDGAVGRIRVARVPTGFWPLTTTNQPVCRTNSFAIRPKCLRAAELRHGI